MNIKPLGDKITTRKTKTENISASGLVLPETDQPDQGVVLAVGKDVKHVRAGDTVVFAKRMGQPIQMDDGEVLLMSEESVMGVL
jgi:chaperonin GroES